MGYYIQPDLASPIAPAREPDPAPVDIFGETAKNEVPQFFTVESGYRFYSPELGRWLSRDPIGEEGGEGLYAALLNNPVSRKDAFGLQTDCCCQWKLDYFDCASLPKLESGIRRVVEKMAQACGRMKSLYEAGPLAKEGYVSGDTLGATGADLTAATLARNPSPSAWSSNPQTSWGSGLPATSIVGGGRTAAIATQDTLQGIGLIGAGFSLYSAIGTADSAGSHLGSCNYLDGAHDIGATALSGYSAASGVASAATIEGGTLANPLLAVSAAAVLSWDLAYRNTMKSVQWERNLKWATESCDDLTRLARRYRQQIEMLRSCCGANGVRRDHE